MFIHLFGNNKGKFSKTAFWFGLAMVLITLKYCLGGMVLWGFQVPAFNATDALAFAGIPGILYGWRRSTDREASKFLVDAATRSPGMGGSPSPGKQGDKPGLPADAP